MKEKKENSCFCVLASLREIYQTETQLKVNHVDFFAGGNHAHRS